MTAKRRSRWLQVENMGPVTVVTFVARAVLDEEAVEGAGQQLAELVDNLRHPQLVLDFGPVERLTSVMLAKLIGLSKKVRAAGGRMVLCGIRPALREVFDLLNLCRIIPTYADQQEALQSFVRVREADR